MLTDFLHSTAAKSPQAPAILAPGRQTLSFGPLSALLHSTTRQLQSWGIGSQDRAALVLANGPAAATAFLAVSSVCACAPLNPAYPQTDFSFSMQDLHVKVLISPFGNEHPARKAAHALGIPVIDLLPDADLAGSFELMSDLSVRTRQDDQPGMGLEDVALVLHTSGTTSRPKIVPISHANLVHSTRNIIDTYQLGAQDRCLNMMPLFHVHGLIAAVAATLVSGGSVICTTGFDPAQILNWLTTLQPTWYTAVPTLHQAVLDNISTWDSAQANLRFIRSCSSALSPQLATALARKFQVPVLEAYGMTEGTHQIASNPLPPQPVKLGSVGMATGTTRISILDENGHLLKPELTGEISIRGENVIQGYENNPLANENNFTDGWLRTGDQGYLDEDGYLFITGRIKELINRGGEKIAPREIDETLQQHPAVRQAVAFPIPHPSLGEDIAAAVVLKPGQQVSARQIRQFAAAVLADFKVPRVIVFLPEIPKGPTGKVQRLQLADRLKTEIEAARELPTSHVTRPPSAIEAALITIWSKTLKIENVSIEDDFLALGGDSLMAAQVIQSVSREFGVSLTLSDLFTYASIDSLAQLIHTRRGGSD